MLGVGGKRFEDFVGVLRDPLLPRLQIDVDDHFGIAPQLIAQKDVLPRRPAGKQQHLGLMVDHFDVDFLGVVAGVAILRRRLDLEAIRPPAGIARRKREFDRRNLAVAPQQHLLGPLGAPGLRARGIVGRLRRQFDGHRPPCQLLGLQIARHREAVSWIGAGGRHEIGHADPRRPPLRPDADREDRNLGIAGCQDGRLDIDSGILGTVAKDDDPSQGTGMLLVDQIAQGLT